MSKYLLRIVAATVAITTMLGLCACKSNKPDASGTNATEESTTMNTQASADTPTAGSNSGSSTTGSTPTNPSTKPTHTHSCMP